MWYHTATIVLLTTFAHPGNPAGVPPQIVPVDERFRKKFSRQCTALSGTSDTEPETPFQRRTPDRNSRRISRMNGSAHPTRIILSLYILTLDAGAYSAELQPVKLATAK